MARIHIPEEFVTSTVAREGPAGRAWIRRLPDVANQLFASWNLTPDGPVMYGYVGVVIPVVHAGMKRVLKISWIDESSAQESLALRLWEGRGAVVLYDENPTIAGMLLERLDHRRALDSVSIEEAARIAGGLLRRLAIPASEGIRTVAEEVSALHGVLPELWERTGRPFPRGLLDVVLGLIEDLSPSESSVMVNTDLHYENVLAGSREPWLAIDPKVLAGDLEFGVAQLLWNRFEELETPGDLEARMSIISEAAGLDLARVRSWSTVRLVDYWIWALSEGFTEDPRRCRRLIHWLRPGVSL